MSWLPVEEASDLTRCSTGDMPQSGLRVRSAVLHPGKGMGRRAKRQRRKGIRADHPTGCSTGDMPQNGLGAGSAVLHLRRENTLQNGAM